MAEEVDEEVASEFLRKHLRQEEEVGDEGTLEDDRDVGGIEEFDLISWGLNTLSSLVLDVDVHLEALKKDE